MDTTMTNDYFLMIENKDHFTDYPLQYDNGQIVYSNPEEFPRYIKNECAYMFEVLKMFEFLKKYPGEWHSYNRKTVLKHVNFLTRCNVIQSTANQMRID
jgi:hypothetical protein